MEEARLTPLVVSMEPSTLDIGLEELYGGTMSFLAIPLPCCRLVDSDLDCGVFVPLKSTVCARAVPLVGGGSGLPLLFLISTQSGSGEGVNGLLGLFGFGKWSFDGGWTLERAGRPSKDQHECNNRERVYYTIIEPPFPAIRARWW